MVPPEAMREQLFQEVHCGRFGAHLSNTKVHSALHKHYWWKGMRADITRWTRACLVCATHNPGRAVRPPLSPIPVNGPFDRVGVDLIQFPRSNSGNQYAVVFVDYLTKWPEVFAVPDQSAATIAQLLVEEIVSRHGVPAEILSDRGRSFLCALMKEVEMLLGFHKVNTSAYHPQTDGLVERYNRTLTSMLSKTVQEGGRDWDKRLPYVLFAYRACCCCWSLPRSRHFTSCMDATSDTSSPGPEEDQEDIQPHGVWNRGACPDVRSMGVGSEERLQGPETAETE